MNGKKIIILCAALCSLVLGSCTVKYSFTGASISPEVKTFSVQPFNNNAQMVAPILAPTLTNTLQDKFSRTTSLAPVSQDGDMAFEGTVTSYTSTPTAVTANELASKNRLTITIKVKYTNRFDPKQNFDKTFTAFQDYDNTQLLQSVEGTLIPEIVDDLVDQVFNASAANW